MNGLLDSRQALYQFCIDNPDKPEEYWKKQLTDATALGVLELVELSAIAYGVKWAVQNFPFDSNVVPSVLLGGLSLAIAGIPVWLTYDFIKEKVLDGLQSRERALSDRIHAPSLEEFTCAANKRVGYNMNPTAIDEKVSDIVLPLDLDGIGEVSEDISDYLSFINGVKIKHFTVYDFEEDEYIEMDEIGTITGDDRYELENVVLVTSGGYFTQESIVVDSFSQNTDMLERLEESKANDVIYVIGRLFEDEGDFEIELEDIGDAYTVT